MLRSSREAKAKFKCCSTKEGGEEEEEEEEKKFCHLNLLKSYIHNFITVESYFYINIVYTRTFYCAF